MFNKIIHDAILKSQRCQRNWDLSKQIPEEHIRVIETAVTQCPSKQNITFYKPIFITNREIIEKIYEKSMGAYTVDCDTGEGKCNTNPQVLANLLVALVEDYDVNDLTKNPQIKQHFGIPLSEFEINNEQYKYRDYEHMISQMESQYKRDQAIAVGIAAGYMNLSSSLMGYSTGCCQCVDDDAVSNILGTNRKLLLLMGIGFKDKNRPRREHHKEPGQMFLSHKKYLKALHVA